MRAVADYVTRESTLLSFRKGDVIHIVHNEQYVDKGNLFFLLFYFSLNHHQSIKLIQIQI